ncbi:Bifunctional NAD(P)H-hydrate repair enzyme Nnr [Clarias magur]|uniref:Bifunctional NAD(P)H-hydrate repair enzyme Nnr n=1 Tax=Clarias magur TaxID=1594786 RepID=A0A8J4XF70_CLAMG|nr:Bifunctional NAD(P)H-hydrate repair enzyme Nnr [Clarias magur]
MRTRRPLTTSSSSPSSSSSVASSSASRRPTSAWLLGRSTATFSPRPPSAGLRRCS